MACQGYVGTDVDAETAYRAAQLSACAGLAQIKAALGSFDRVESIVKLEVCLAPVSAHAHLQGFVRSAPGFTAQPAVINGASDLLAKVLGERGRHSRAAVGVNELPLGAAVEICFIVAIKD